MCAHGVWGGGGGMGNRRCCDKGEHSDPDGNIGSTRQCPDRSGRTVSLRLPATLDQNLEHEVPLADSAFA